MRLGPRTWPELDGAPAPVLLLPLGSTEQHGPHLPLETDTLIAGAIADAAAERADVRVAPPLPYGASGEHAGFPGTLSLGQEALELVLLELGRSADGFAGVVLVSWHGGNAAPVARAVARLQEEGRRVSAWTPRLDAGDLHAGRTETSLLLAIAPELVRAGRPAGATGPLRELLPALMAGGVAAVSPSGVLGDARGASAAEGAALLDRLADDLAGWVEATRA